MYIPKLKIGDKFVYTQKMNDAKLNSSCFSNALELVGRTVTILKISDDTDSPTKLGYILKEDEKGRMYHTDMIDKLLTPNFMGCTNGSLTEQFCLLFKSEPEKSFRMAGITNGDDQLTSDGQTVFLSWMLKKHGAEFLKEVVTPILEAKKEEK